jgi:hypothetical protein
MNAFIPYFAVLATLTVLRLDLSIAAPSSGTTKQPCLEEPTKSCSKVLTSFQLKNLQDYITFVACEKGGFQSLAGCSIYSTNSTEFLRVIYTCKDHPRSAANFDFVKVTAKFSVSMNPAHPNTRKPPSQA